MRSLELNPGTESSVPSVIYLAGDARFTHYILISTRPWKEEEKSRHLFFSAPFQHLWPRLIKLAFFVLDDCFVFPPYRYLSLETKCTKYGWKRFLLLSLWKHLLGLCVGNELDLESIFRLPGARVWRISRASLPGHGARAKCGESPPFGRLSYRYFLTVTFIPLLSYRYVLTVTFLLLLSYRYFLTVIFLLLF